VKGKGGDVKGKGEGKAEGEQKGKGGEGERPKDSGDCSSTLPSDKAVERVLRGEGRALDPSSAMERAYRDGLAKGNIGHEVYVGNGSKDRVVSEKDMKSILR